MAALIFEFLALLLDGTILMEGTADLLVAKKSCEFLFTLVRNNHALHEMQKLVRLARKGVLSVVIVDSTYAIQHGDKTLKFFAIDMEQLIKFVGQGSGHVSGEATHMASGAARVANVGHTHLARELAKQRSGRTGGGGLTRSNLEL